MVLGNWLKRRHKKWQKIWVVKQVDEADEALLHLCGEGAVEADDAAQLLKRLRDGEYRGAVRMKETGALLNAGQFAALIPQDDFQLYSDRDANWRGRQWHVAWTPQRCWLHEGRLVTLPSQVDGHPCLVSSEDVSDIRAKAEASDTPAPYFALESLDSIRRDGPTPPGHQGSRNDRSR
ncbi:hypothetical protein [Modicisalibacter radicis]|uniref:hypothetical protein n=1 Tax=Halomonas sp. EAR18 TaxID=2518972 RepID=UPI00109C9BFF|nr:hypothetical protein [Halomonas sp. EAR18]